MKSGQIERLERNHEDFKMMDIQETAEYLHISLNSLYKKYYLLPHIKIGNRILFCKYRLNDWLIAHLRNNVN